MWTLAVALVLAQAEPVVPPAADAPVEQPAANLTPPPPPAQPAPELKPNTLGRKASFFGQPQVGPGVLVGRVGMSLLTSAAGGVVGAGFLALGGFFSLVGAGGLAPLIIGGVLATAVLGLGAALGAAMFGSDYGADLGDAVAVALVLSLISVTGVIVALLVSLTPVVITAIAVGVLLPAVGTPLFVQAFKKGDAPEPTVALATF